MCLSKLRVGICVLIFMRDTEHALDPHGEASEEFTEAVLDRPQAPLPGRPSSAHVWLDYALNRVFSGSGAKRFTGIGVVPSAISTALINMASLNGFCR
jgi:hypothetical protein